jgi:hypothetical protein
MGAVLGSTNAYPAGLRDGLAYRAQSRRKCSPRQLEARGGKRKAFEPRLKSAHPRGLLGEQGRRDQRCEILMLVPAFPVIPDLTPPAWARRRWGRAASRTIHLMANWTKSGLSAPQG